MPNLENYYITTPIYYVNDVPHLGHAYTTIACDTMARFMRLDGKEVFFLTGTDEHGQKVEKSALEFGESPQVFTDRVSQRFRDLTEKLGASNDDFIRTTEPRHILASQKIWKSLVDTGDIYLDSYSGWYSVRDEAYFAENELKSDGAGGYLAPSGGKVEWVEEPSYFFRLSRWQDKLLKLYADQPSFISPKSRRNEVIRFVEGGLQDLSVSRTSFKWGVPVPGNDTHIMYVWLDALTNYLTATGYPDQSGSTFQRFWTSALHIVGKDILRFHAVYWPAFLMSAGLPIPKRVFAHGWWTVEGEKMSKSSGNVVDPFELIDTFGLDQVRYFLLREVPFGSDGDFSITALKTRINSDLSNDFGNLVQRVLSMINSNCDGAMPTPGSYQKEDVELLRNAGALLNDVRSSVEEQALSEALEKIWQIIREANSYVDHQAPWKLKSTDQNRMETVLFILSETIRKIAILMQPFVPTSAGKILDQLNVPKDSRNFAFLANDHSVESKALLPKPVGVFPRHLDT